MAPAVGRPGGTVSAEARFDLHESGSVCFGELAGEIDLSNAKDLSEQIYDAIPNECVWMLLDLGGVGYLDSSGVAVLFDIIRSLETRRQRLVLVVPGGAPLRRLLELSGVDRVVPIEATLADARRRAADTSA